MYIYNDEYFKFFEISLFISIHNVVSTNVEHNIDTQHKKIPSFLSSFHNSFRGIDRYAPVLSRLIFQNGIFKGIGEWLKKKKINKERAYFTRKNVELKSKWLIKKNEETSRGGKYFAVVKS